MRWTKIKNIILIILVLVNLFLLGLVGTQAWRTAQNDRQTGERMLQILENNSIRFEPEVLPDAMTLTARKLTPDPMEETDAALLLDTVDTWENAGTRTVYHGKLGTLSVSTEREALWELAPDVTLTEAELWERFKRLGLAFQETGRVEEGDTLTVTACLLYDGVPIPGQQLRLTLVDGRPTNVSFPFLRGTSEAMAGEATISAATALLRLLDALNEQGYICSRISDLYAGYALTGDTTLTLEPMWFVEIDTAPWRLAVHAITGVVTAE